ncbi:MAG: universal stress protein [Rhodobacteraceae bacterium]|nr:universal stress protein [Paracoccaceae bacterium]
MSYKSLLTVVTDEDVALVQLRQAAALARMMDAHLEIMCLGVDTTQIGYAYAGVNAAFTQDAWRRAVDDGRALRTLCETEMNGSDLRWSAEDGAVGLADLGRRVARHAQFCDLVVQPKPYVSGAGPGRDTVVEAALFEGRAPVMVMPAGVQTSEAPGTVLAAWNESPEALTAMRRALPLLKLAKTVHIVVVDPPVHSPDRSDPGGPLSQMLARHGVHCEIDVLGKTMNRVSDVLSRHAMDISADLIVMGAYGHSRLREAIMGGASRNMLQIADVPLFMAH